LRFEAARALGIDMPGVDWTSPKELLEVAEMGSLLKERDQPGAALTHLLFACPPLLEIAGRLPPSERRVVLRAGACYLSLLTHCGRAAEASREADEVLHLAAEFRAGDGAGWADALDAAKEAGYCRRHLGHAAAGTSYRLYRSAYAELISTPLSLPGLRMSVARGLAKAIAQLAQGYPGGHPQRAVALGRVQDLMAEAAGLAGADEPFDDAVLEWIQNVSMEAQCEVGLGRYDLAFQAGKRLVTPAVRRYVEEVGLQRPESPLPSAFSFGEAAFWLANGSYKMVARQARAQARRLLGGFLSGYRHRFERIAEAAAAEDDRGICAALVGPDR
jgi:hypothetical protein